MHADPVGNFGIDAKPAGKTVSRHDGRKNVENPLIAGVTVQKKNHKQDAYATIGLGAAAAIVVWAVYYPADATGVELGSALGMTCTLMMWVLAMIWWVRFKPTIESRDASWWVDVSSLALAAWVLLAAWVTGGIFSASMPTVGGDLRSATNEAWWWIAAAGYFVVMRRLMFDASRVRVVFGLLLGVGVLLSVHTLHQSFVSLPETMHEYVRDPEAALSSIGLNAPPGSAARMIYENRLRDGGPTATFALANSVAGPLAMIATLSGGCLMCLLRSLRRRVNKAESAKDTPPPSHGVFLTVILFAIFCLMMVALLMTGSRSGVLSIVVVAFGFAISSMWRRAGRSLRVSLACLLGMSVLVLLVWWRAGDDSWAGGFAAGARATLELRVQYWQSTLAMVIDYPWFGAGPGNFQLVYQFYRDVRAHEMIAEPHNFMMETLACGGLIAAVLLTICAVAGYRVYRRELRGIAPGDDEPEIEFVAHSEPKGPSTVHPGDARSLAKIAVAVGAFVGLLTVWYYGISSGELPDFEAHLYAVPVAMITMAVWWIADSAARPILSGFQLRRIAGASATCGLIHLCFSGGWTIPGVSIILIWLAGIATSTPNVGLASNATASQVSASPRPIAMTRLRNAKLAVLATGCVLIFVMVRFSLRPVQRTRAAMSLAATQLKTHRISAAEATLGTVIQDDPHATDAAIWLADMANRKVIRAFTSSATIESDLSQQTHDAFALAIVRAGNNPPMIRTIGELLLQRYQVGGRIEDLAQAEKLIAKAVELSPTHETMIAQQSEIVRELTARGVPVDGMSAAQLSQRAMMLAGSGGVITRDLNLQLIMPARQIGLAASETPLRIAAGELLRTQPDGPQSGNRAK